MGLGGFVGNEKGVAVLRQMLVRDRIPGVLLFAGQKGVGKFTLASLVARALLCRNAEADFCGECADCRALAALDDVPGLLEQAQKERKSADPEEVPLLLQPHLDVTVLVPDPTYIRMSQMRAARKIAYTAPSRTRRLILIDDAERLRRDLAGALLKVLEEPPPTTHFILVTHALFELPDTIRSRTVTLHFAPLPQEKIEGYLAEHRPKLGKKDRLLLASTAAGSLGKALSLDLEHYRRVRAFALEFLRAAAGEAVEPARLFEATSELAGRSRRLAEEEGGPGGGRAEFEFSLDLLYSLASDVLYVRAQASDLSLQNPDIRSELERLSRQVEWPWLAGWVAGLDRIERGLRRNVNRQLALDALALGRRPGKFGETLERATASQ